MPKSKILKIFVLKLSRSEKNQPRGLIEKNRRDEKKEAISDLCDFLLGPLNIKLSKISKSEDSKIIFKLLTAVLTNLNFPPSFIKIFGYIDGTSPEVDFGTFLFFVFLIQ